MVSPNSYTIKGLTSELWIEELTLLPQGSYLALRFCPITIDITTGNKH